MKKIKIITSLYLLISTAYAHSNKILFPLECELGKSCWISSLPRHYVQDKYLDFRCGSITYKNNDGTDIALKDIKQMQQGVSVIAPISGIVEVKQDDIIDISAKDIGNKSAKGKECGNEIVISNDEMLIQLCHLKNKSIRVNVGDKIKAGDIIGKVGLSGSTEYPHLHMSVRDKSDTREREIDPFYGAQSDCGLKPQSLWSNPELMEKQATTGLIYNYGFAFENITLERSISGDYTYLQPEYPATFIAFVDIFSVNKGDKLTISILDARNNVLAKREHEFAKYQTRYFLFVEKKLRGERLRGNYSLVVKYKHASGKEEELNSSIKL